MSVEALLTEVSPTLPLTQVIKSAEQLYFKEHLLHTNVVPEYHAGSAPGTSGQGQDKAAKKDKKGKGDHHDEDSQNPLSAAINAVKNTVSSVLGGGSQGSVSNAEVAELRKAVGNLKLDNESLRKEVSDLRKLVEKVLSGDKSATQAAAPAKKETEAAAGGDDDFDLGGSDEEEESEEAKQVREKRLADYAAKKAKKPGPIAKSNIIYDVKPWDDTIDTKEIEKKVREIEKDGLVWGAAKILPVAFGIKKLQICCVVEDEKVSSDWLEEQITDIEDLVQSVDVVAFNKV